MINTIFNNKAENILPQLPNDSIDMVLTDPPYFLCKMDDNWSPELVNNKKFQGKIKSLPAGMSFDRQQGKNLYDWYYKISLEIFRILKPGGFFFSFSSPRLYHRLASAMDDAGFEIRDMFSWLYTSSQVKAMSMNNFIKNLKITEKEKDILKNKLEGLKTPQVKSCFEPIAMGQKPKKDSYLNNYLLYDVGLINTNIKQGKNNNYFISNVISTEPINEIIDNFFLVAKPDKKEKGEGNTHKTVKPLLLCEFLITIFTKENAIILDPFAGSGTTLLAAKNNNRNYIGIEINEEYVNIIKNRLQISKEDAE